MSKALQTKKSKFEQKLDRLQEIANNLSGASGVRTKSTKNYRHNQYKGVTVFK